MAVTLIEEMEDIHETGKGVTKITFLLMTYKNAGLKIFFLFLSSGTL